MKTITVLIDFSDVTDNVVQVTQTFASTCCWKVYLIHIAPPFIADLHKITVPPHERKMLAGELRKEHRELQAIANQLVQSGLDAEALLVEGVVVDKILEQVVRLKSDLIIMGSHGHGKLYHLIAGSVCEGVLRKTTVPVMLVPRMEI